ncbi:MAG: hypothetical protein Q4C20_01315 [Erysipelotrichaceae bacterium]|nr:hypothetical protein [Erysipelotrichaceae bacterium]
MKYKFHEGIVYTVICNVHMLVATRNVWDQFPAVKELSALQACFWRGISEGMDEEELMNAIHLPSKMNLDTVRQRYHLFVNKMVDEGYLIPEEQSC